VTNSPRWESVVRRAARELAPVQVRHEGDATRSSFLSGLVERGDDTWLRVSPWPASTFVGPTLVDAPLEGWRLRMGSVSRGDDVLWLPLSRARFETLAMPSDVDLASLVLVCPTGVDDLFVHPVVGLDAQGCVIETPIGLSTGHTFPHVELHGDRGILRSASAVVSSSEAWVDHFGRPFFRHRLRFDVPLAPETVPPDYDVIADPERLDRVLRLACLLGLEIVSSEPGDERRYLARRGEARLETSGSAWRSIGPIEIAFELFALRYEATVRVVGAHATTLPLLLRRRRRRTESRVDTRAQSYRLLFEHPLRPRRVEASVIDLSARGLCFTADERDLLWPGLVLGSSSVHGPHGRVDLGKLEVRSLESDRAHARILRDDVGTDLELGELLASLRHPDLTPHDGSTFDTQLALYRHAGLVMPYMAELLDHAKDEAARSWWVAHRDAPSLCRTFARYEGDDAVASVTALQAWERTWLGQHLAAIPERTGCTPGELLMSFMDYVVLRPDCRQMVFFVAAKNTRMNAIQEQFQALTGTPEAAVRVPLRAWLFRAPCERDTPDVRRADGADRRVLARSTLRDWGGLAQRAFSFDEASSTLASLGPRYARAGLLRRREISVTRDARLPRWAAVTERCSPGLCIPGLTQATWLLPLHAGPDDAAHVRSLVASLRLEAHEPHRIVLTSALRANEPFEAAGLTHAFDAYAYVLNRAGLRRYASYLLESYGTKGALRAEARVDPGSPIRDERSQSDRPSDRSQSDRIQGRRDERG
jgi:hypothetical protein